MKLGAFSVSLRVKDIAASQAFYTALGFETFHDMSAHGYCILRNGDTLIGLFEGHIETNVLTFNPGWDQNAAEVQGAWDDVRDIQARLQSAGLDLSVACDPDTSGPAHIMLTDPDGNAILIDQHR